MKTKIIIVCVVFFSFPALAADQLNKENAQSTQLNYRQETAVQYQARVKPDDTSAMLQAMQRYRFTKENTLRVRRMLKDAQQQELPTTPITDKVSEGIAKKIDEDTIVRAAVRVLERYQNAYRRASTLTTDKQLARQLGRTLAGAYTAGLKDEDCARIMTRLRTRTRKNGAKVSMAIAACPCNW